MFMCAFACASMSNLETVNNCFYPLTVVTAIWQFDVITHVAIHQTRLDYFSHVLILLALISKL